MNVLSRIPFWGWYLFSVAFCYWVWNPYFGLTQALATDADAAYKALAVILTLIVGSLYIIEGHRTLNIFGITLFVALFGCIFWISAKNGLHNFESIKWWGQWIVGLLLTIAIQGGRIYRSLTGRQPVALSNDDTGHHHHS